MKLSLVMPVYNEVEFLREALSVPMKYCHEAIFVDGSPYGPSNDGTKEVIDDYKSIYPDKVKYFSGTFAKEDGSWAQSEQRNIGLGNVTGEYVLQYEGDILYTEESMVSILETIEACPARGIFYCPLIEFWLNQDTIRLYADGEFFVRPKYGIIPIYSMELNPIYKDGAQVQLSGKSVAQSVCIPHAFRFHYGWMGFRRQFNKHMRNVLGGLWGGAMETYRRGPREDLVKWIIEHIRDYPNYPYAMPYTGPKPLAGRQPSFLSGYAETLVELETEYGMDLTVYKLGITGSEE